MLIPSPPIYDKQTVDNVRYRPANKRTIHNSGIYVSGVHFKYLLSFIKMHKIQSLIPMLAEFRFTK